MRSDRPCRDDGFSLVELLVAMAVVAALAAVAVPVYLNQRARAYDTSARSDASRLGREITAYYADAPATPPSVVVSGGHYLVAGANIGGVSPGVRLGTRVPVPVATTTVDTSAWTSTSWCVNVFHPDGAQVYFSYSAAAGLHTGACP
jgi:type IV pilus assembly protein PilA